MDYSDKQIQQVMTAGTVIGRARTDAVKAKPNPPRPRCDRCQRPSSYCLCAHIPSLANRTRVLILQHPDEAKHPLNTARLAALGLQDAELWVGEHFPQLTRSIASAQHALLLFPAKGKSKPEAMAAACPTVSSLLIVPDGTWRKARRIVQENPVLDTLARLSLPSSAPSEYRVRKASEPAAVSTIEAIVRALSTLEPQQNFETLLTPFRALVAQQIEAMGEDVYRRNYST